MLLNKIVARFKNGSLLKGKLLDFSPDKRYFHLELESGEVVTVDLQNLKVVEIQMEELKAAFFVKDFKGNKDHVDMYNDVITGSGKKVQVEFSDGEVIIGHTQGYSEERHGFFVTPADSQSNNERIFVIRSATKNITFL